jgi:hypothetical protein
VLCGCAVAEPRDDSRRRCAWYGGCAGGRASLAAIGPGYAAHRNLDSCPDDSRARACSVVRKLSACAPREPRRPSDRSAAGLKAGAANSEKIEGNPLFLENEEAPHLLPRSFLTLRLICHEIASTPMVTSLVLDDRQSLVLYFGQEKTRIELPLENLPSAQQIQK